MRELDVPDGRAIPDLPDFREIKPDLSLEVRIPSYRLTFDLLRELDLPVTPPTTATSSSPTTPSSPAGRHARDRTLGTRPSPSSSATTTTPRSSARRRATGRIGAMGTTPHDRYDAGRDHVFFAAVPDIHHGPLAALALSPLPPSVRADLRNSEQLELARVHLMPSTM